KVGATYFRSRYPAFEPSSAFATSAGFRFYMTADTTNGGEDILGAKQDKPFYVWASEIVGGRVVATDYAPDNGWLLPTPGSKPGGTYVLEREDRAHSGLPRLSMTL